MPDRCPIAPAPPPESLPFATDRSGAWQALRDAGDVVLTDNGVYFITGAESIEAAAKQPELFSSAGAFDFLGSPFPLIPIAVDPPEHTRYRRMLDKFFSPRSMAALETDLRKQVNALIDAIEVGPAPCDIVDALAVPFPSQVFLTLFGLPLEDRARLIDWKNGLVRFIDTGNADPTPEVLTAAAEMVGYLGEHMTARRNSEGSDLLTLLLSEEGNNAITDAEFIGLCFIFVIAGLDTVTSAIGFAFAALAQDPALRARLVDDLDSPQQHVITEFIEEVLRVESPVPFVPRVTTRAARLGDVEIPAGSSCMLALGSANRDPSRYFDADTIHDQRSNHFAFGRGPHRCLGSHLARLELRVVLQEWHRRIPQYSLPNDAVPEVVWPSSTMTLDRVDLSIDRR